MWPHACACTGSSFASRVNEVASRCLHSLSGMRQSGARRRILALPSPRDRRIRGSRVRGGAAGVRAQLRRAARARRRVRRLRRAARRSWTSGAACATRATALPGRRTRSCSSTRPPRGSSAMTLALAHSRGWLDYDERVTTYWPEFAQAGKQRGHGAAAARPRGGPAGDRRAARPRACSRTSTGWRRSIARQRPAWPPGTRHGYHGVSLGWYEGELIRRVDPERPHAGALLRRGDRGAARARRPFRRAGRRGPRAHRPHRARPAAEGAAAAAPPAAGRWRWRCSTRARSAFRTFANPRLRSPADLDRERVPAARVPRGRGGRRRA